MIKDDQVTSPKHEGLRDAQQNISLPFFHLKRKRLAVVEIAISRESKLKSAEVFPFVATCAVVLVLAYCWS